MFDIISTISYYSQTVLKTSQEVSTPLRYLAKISPTLSAINYIAKTQIPAFLDYVPFTTQISSAYGSIHKTVSKTLNKHSLLRDLISHKNTATAFSAIATTSALISCGAPAILIAGGSFISATSTLYKYNRSEALGKQEAQIDRTIYVLEQEYPYICDTATLSITDPKSADHTHLNSHGLTGLDYVKLVLDMGIAYSSSPLGQTNLISIPIMIFREKQNINRIQAKEQKLQAMLEKLRPVDRERLKHTIESMSASNSTPGAERARRHTDHKTVSMGPKSHR